MPKTLASVLIIAVVIFGGFLIIKNGKGVEPTPDVNTQFALENQPAQTSDDTAGKKIPFSEFVKQGGTYKCDVKQAMSDFDNSGTVYINGSTIREDLTTIAEGRSVKSSVIIKDGALYSWQPEISTKGGKIKPVVFENWSGEIGDYTCTPWTVDASVFTLPANITFEDITGRN